MKYIKITRKVICMMEWFRYCHTGTTTVYIIYRYTISSIDIGNRSCETSVLYYRDVQNRIKKKKVLSIRNECLLWPRLDVVIFLYDLYEKQSRQKDYTWEKTPSAVTTVFGVYLIPARPNATDCRFYIYKCVFLKTLTTKFGIEKRGLHVTRHAFVIFCSGTI